MFTPQALELKTGDSIRFTRYDREAGRINGGRGEVIAVDAQARTATIRTQYGSLETLNLDAARDRHIAHAYVETAFAAQGRTADRVIIHADSRATDLIDQKSFYVGISRAKVGDDLHQRSGKVGSSHQRTRRAGADRDCGSDFTQVCGGKGGWGRDGVNTLSQVSGKAWRGGSGI